MVYILGAFFVVNREMTVGMLILFSESFGMLFTNLDAVNSKNVALDVSRPYFSRICEALEFDEEEEKSKQEIKLEGDIELSGVSFCYHENKTETLNNVSLKIEKNDYLAVMGKSGCGKTTLIKLILNLYNPQKGSIKMDGINIANIKKKNLYSQIGAVMQDTYLFNMSIRENLLLSKKDATLYELEQACEQAGIRDFIMSLPYGFETIIGERGVKLSGGQKQRIAIAQALIKTPKLILLDEATSSIDKISEDTINKSIHDIASQTTIVIISHKPSTILKARRIALMEDGNIIDGDDLTLKESHLYSKIMGRGNGNG